MSWSYPLSSLSFGDDVVAGAVQRAKKSWWDHLHRDCQEHILLVSLHLEPMVLTGKVNMVLVMNNCSISIGITIYSYITVGAKHKKSAKSRYVQDVPGQGGVPREAACDDWYPF